MANRALRAGFFVMPLVAFGFALASGCSDDENPNPIVDRNDGSSDVNAIDVRTTDSSSPGFDSGNPQPQDSGNDTGTGNDSGGGDSGGDDDSGIGDAGISDADAMTEGDADADSPDADAGMVTALCTTYPNDPGFEDGGAGEPGIGRWDLIALRAILSGVNNAASSCQINTHFNGNGAGAGAGTPAEFDCFGQQLRVLVGCATPTSYEIANDFNGAACVPDGGTPQVQLGFYDHNGVFDYHRADIDFLITLVREAAVSTGMPGADADRLVAILEAKRNSLLTNDAGADAGDGGFSAYACP